MASVSVSHLIIFIAAMLVAASVAGLLTSTVDDLSNAIEEQGFSTSDDIRSDITIINDAGATEVEEEELTLYIKNTGNTELSAEPEDVDVLVNGIFTTDFTVDIQEEEVWGQGIVVELTITVSDEEIDQGENRVQVVAGGAEDVFIWEQ